MARERSSKRAALGAAGAVGALAFLRKRRRRLHNATEEIHDTLLPPGVDEPMWDIAESRSDGHAPGHQHLAPPPETRSTGTESPNARRRYVRPFRR